MNKLKRLAILTGGGDCPGLNAVIRAVVHTAEREYGLEVLGVLDGYAGLIHDRVKRLSLDDVSGILPRGGTILGTSNRDNPFHFPLAAGPGPKKFGDVSPQVRRTIEKNGIDALIVAGGDGSQHIALKLREKYDLPVVGIPKTIDNDLGGTDVTFGFDTALQVATAAVDKLHSTAESHHRVMILEVMGRNAGWIALGAGLAGGGDVILIPEIPYAIAKVVEKISDRIARGKRFSLVVVAEGAKPEGGDVVVARRVESEDEPLRLGGVSQRLGTEIEDRTGMETRFTILGHVQRGGSPSPFDRILASRFGFHAVQAAAAGKFATLVGLRGQRIELTPIAEALAAPRRVDPDSDLVRSARALGTSFGA